MKIFKKNDKSKIKFFLLENDTGDVALTAPAGRVNTACQVGW